MPADTLQGLFRSANDEVFEDGMDSHFGGALRDFVQEHGIAAVRHLNAAIHSDGTPAKVAGEALRQVGYMSDTKTHDARLTLLEHSLESQEIRIRDAASIGIEAMEDPAAIPALKRAIENESAGWLLQYLKDVMNQLMPQEVPEEG